MDTSYQDESQESRLGNGIFSLRRGEIKDKESILIEEVLLPRCSRF